MLNENYLKKLWDSVPENGDLETGNRIWSAINVAVRRKNGRRREIYAVASMFSVAAALAAGVFFGMQLSDRIQAEPDKELVAIAENAGYMLPDGSTVWMGHGGSLRFHESFKGEREVWLDGNASFEVVHEKDSTPFFVHLQHADVKVTGTGFTVRHTSSEEVTVTLHHGRVEFVARNSEPLVLEPKQAVTYNTLTGECSLGSFFRNITWQAGHYKIENADLRGLVQFVEWQYGTSVSICDMKDDSQKFNGTIAYDEPLEQVLDKICYVLKISYKKDGKAYRLYK